MTPDVIALFRELADRSPEERVQYYLRHAVPAVLSAEVESLLRFDGESRDEPRGRVAAAAQVLLDGRDTRGAGTVEDRAATVPPILATGTVFGPYRIVTPLGRGGMGVVYAADEVESGRRVALKVLTAAPQSMRERERFEREGRLAASLNHPHCVFVFAASEIDGHPVIAMEVMQETLADRLKRDGPLPPAAAVDAMLQIVAGLQAAAAAGILHRDVKPSNCFVDAQGVVKIGDFGISRSQRPTEETAFSTHGPRPATPAYASPEQLRGAALDVRTDIYSVCATLYELLTGRRPFEAPDLMTLLMAIANDTPSAPHAVAPAVPKGVSAVVLRGLAKQPQQRFADYNALAAALEPYSSTAPTTATLGRRCLACLIDYIALGAVGFALYLWWSLDWYSIPSLLTMPAAAILYFGACEGLWAATPGKAICGLTVVQQGGAPARMWLVMVRAITFVIIPAMPMLVLASVCATCVESQFTPVGFGPVRPPAEPMGPLMASPESLQVVTSAAYMLMFVLLFSTARRHNGYAAIHDLISRTRVVERRERVRQLTSSPVPAHPPSDIVRHLGPFAVLAGGVSGLPDGWRSGFDERLRRPIWIREVAPGTPPISPARRSINRATRLRWLAGRRNDQEAWDAFEAVQGTPLDRAVLQPRSWHEVRAWLADLARECRAHGAHDQPLRRLDCVWVLDSGGAKLIDDPAHDQIVGSAGGYIPVAQFLVDIAQAARGSAQTHPRPSPRSTATPWPLHGHQFIERLTAEPTMDAASIVNTIESLMRYRPAVTQAWRLVTVVIPLLLPALYSLAALLLILAGEVIRRESPADLRIAAQLLRALDQDARGVRSLSQQDREGIETALTGRYRTALADERLFSPFAAFAFFMLPRHHRLADDLLRRDPASTAGSATPLSAAVETMITMASGPAPSIPWSRRIAIMLSFGVFILFLVATAALVSAIAWRGGVMRILGLEIVTTDGRTATRPRVFLRTALTWSPVLLLGLMMILWRLASSESAGSPTWSGQSMLLAIFSALANPWVAPISLLVLLAGAVVAIVNPARGIPDRLAGTWIVPR
jgi:uncharacterized RDD family membrane protein YckC